MPESMSRRAPAIALVAVLAVCATGCGSSRRQATTTTTSPKAQLVPVRTCLRQKGYAVTAESADDVRTAPPRFEFFAVWNILNPSRVAVALAFSRTADGAKQAAIWTRRTNAKIGKGAVAAPVVRLGTVDVLWTAAPGPKDVKDVYGCLHAKP